MMRIRLTHRRAIANVLVLAAALVWIGGPAGAVGGQAIAGLLANGEIRTGPHHLIGNTRTTCNENTSVPALESMRTHGGGAGAPSSGAWVLHVPFSGLISGQPAGEAPHGANLHLCGFFAPTAVGPTRCSEGTRGYGGVGWLVRRGGAVARFFDLRWDFSVWGDVVVLTGSYQDYVAGVPQPTGGRAVMKLWAENICGGMVPAGSLATVPV